MTAPIPNHDGLITRRSISLVAASLLCSPAIVRATSLMPVRRLISPIKRASRLDPLGEFYRRCFYHNLDFELRTGRSMTMVVENGKIISVADARRMVAYARAHKDGCHRRRCPICRNLARAATLAPGNISIKEKSMKKEYRPMLATLVDQPFDSKDWVYETKWDGFRLVAEVRRGLGAALLS